MSGLVRIIRPINQDRWSNAKVRTVESKNALDIRKDGESGVCDATWTLLLIVGDTCENTLRGDDATHTVINEYDAGIGRERILYDDVFQPEVFVSDDLTLSGRDVQPKPERRHTVVQSTTGFKAWVDGDPNRDVRESWLQEIFQVLWKLQEGVIVALHPISTLVDTLLAHELP